MRIGMSMSSTERRLPARAAAAHVLERVRAARAAQLDTLTFGDSHTRSDARYFQNTPTLARALGEWDPERAAGCLFLVPMWPPVLLAEQVGTLAAFHEGPFIVQTGLGDAAAFRRFGVEVAHRSRALDESIRIVDALFVGEVVTSPMFGIEEASIDLVPPEGVDWWIGTMSDAGLERAARLGATWYASHGAFGDRLRRMSDRYRDACERHDASPTIALRRDAVVLADGDRARSLAREALASGYRGMTSDMVVAGTPDDVAAALAPLGQHGVDEVMLRTMGLGAEIDIETITQLGEVRRLLA